MILVDFTFELTDVKINGGEVSYVQITSLERKDILILHPVLELAFFSSFSNGSESI